MPGVDELLREAAIRYFFVDTHGILLADRRARLRQLRAALLPHRAWPPSGVTPSRRSRCGARARATPATRTTATSTATSASTCPLDYIGPYIHPEGHRTYTGIKYHAITHEQLHDKWVYDPAIARQRAGGARGALPDDATATGRSASPAAWIAPRSSSAPTTPSSSATGGTRDRLFLGDLFRQLHYDQQTVEAITPGDYLDRHPTNQVATPSASSWGWKGYDEYWLDESNAWVYRHLHVAGERMVELAHRHPAAAGSSSAPSTRPRAS